MNRNILRQIQADLIRNILRLCKGRQIVERKHHLGLLRTFDFGRLFAHLILLHRDRGQAHVSLRLHNKRILLHMECDRCSKVRHVFHQATELAGREAHRTRIGGLRNLQMLAVDVHQFHSVFCFPGSICTFKGDSKRISVFCMSQQDRIGGLGTLHNLRKGHHINSQGDWLRTTVQGTGIGENGEIHEGYMGCIHRLEFDALFGTQEVDIDDEFLDGVQDTL